MTGHKSPPISKASISAFPSRMIASFSIRGSFAPPLPLSGFLPTPPLPLPLPLPAVPSNTVSRLRHRQSKDLMLIVEKGITGARITCKGYGYLLKGKFIASTQNQSVWSKAVLSVTLMQLLCRTATNCSHRHRRTGPRI
jgi:hypothetical protein